MSWALTILLAGALAAVEPLNEAQLRQLQTATDFTPTWDEPSLYPLLQNVLRWDTLDEAGAMIPDWDALLADPEAYRGRLFLVRGQLGGPPETVPRTMARPGPWDGRMQRWSVLYRVNPDQVAVVYMVDPPPASQTPRVAARVWILCRFYKIWRFDDIQGRTTDYPVFIAKTITTPAAGSGRPPVADGGPFGGFIVGRVLPVSVLLLIVLYFILKRTGGGGGLLSSRPRPLPSQIRRVHERGAGTPGAPATPGTRPATRASIGTPDLPADPAEALDRLAGMQSTADSEQDDDEESAADDSSRR